MGFRGTHHITRGPGFQPGTRCYASRASRASWTERTPTSSHCPAIALRPAGSMLASGTMHRANPICAASRTRWAACVTARTSPARPTSPNMAVVAGTTRFRKLEAIAATNAKVRGGFVHCHPPGDVDEHVVAEQIEAGALLQHREQQRQPLLIDPARHPPRRAVGGRAHERLDLHQNRARALDRAEHGRPGRVRGPFRQKQLRGIRNGTQAARGHLEDAELADGAKTVLDGAHDAVRVMPFALEIQNGMDHVSSASGRQGCRPSSRAEGTGHVLSFA